MSVCQLNYLIIFASFAISMGMGMLWYSPLLFWKLWVHLSGYDESRKEENKGRVLLGIIATTLLTVFFLALFISALKVTSFSQGMLVGILAWAGFVMPTQFNAVLWSGQNPKEWLLNASFQLINLVIIGGILAAWS